MTAVLVVLDCFEISSLKGKKCNKKSLIRNNKAKRKYIFYFFQFYIMIYG